MEMRKLHLFLLLIALSFQSCFANTLCTRPDERVFSNQELFENKRIVILGGTGYLGRHIIEKVLGYNPMKIITLGRDEVKQFQLRTLFNHPKVEAILGDIRDYESVLAVTKNADIVFHAAALKRIDSLESNVEESIKTNILGSLNVFKACVANHVPKVLFISTDKACLPINAYGACKFVSEKIFTNYDQSQIDTQFIVARFGNILESTGSVIPTFVERIKQGKTVILTHPAMTRFIIDKDQAISLLFDALRYGIGGEVFVRSMPSMQIGDLLEIIRAKLQATNDVKVAGLRPGEKMDEVIINAAEFQRTVAFRNCYIIRPSIASLTSLEGNQPLYLREGEHIMPSPYDQYSSEQVVISKEELSLILQKCMDNL